MLFLLNVQHQYRKCLSKNSTLLQNERAFTQELEKTLTKGKVEQDKKLSWMYDCMAEPREVDEVLLRLAANPHKDNEAMATQLMLFLKPEEPLVFFFCLLQKY